MTDDQKVKRLIAATKAANLLLARWGLTGKIDFKRWERVQQRLHDALDAVEKETKP